MRQKETATFALTPSGPFSWEAACDVVAHFGPISRHWSGSGNPLRIAFPLDGSFAPVAVALRWDGTRLVGKIAGSQAIDAVASQVARLFSLDIDGTGFDELGRRDPALGRLISAFPGLRPVCFTSPYECAAWAILSQRISMRQAATTQGRLIERLGTRLEVDGGEAWAFPSPERLALLDELPGLAQLKAVRLRAVANAALEGLLGAERLRELGPVKGPESVRVIPGIGPFWASGIYLRGCGIADEFPDEPLSLAALGALHGLGDHPDRRTAAFYTDQYRPYGMWVSFLLRVAVNRGVIPGVAGREGEIRNAPTAQATTTASPRIRHGSSFRAGEAAAIAVGTAGRQEGASPGDALGAVTGMPKMLLRAEGVVALAAGAGLYLQLGGAPIAFVPLLFAVDVSMVGYLGGPRSGALIYNLVHNWAAGVAVLALAWWLGSPAIGLVGAILVAHTGMDRAAGYGLKYPTAFADTHLGRLGRARRPTQAPVTIRGS